MNFYFLVPPLSPVFIRTECSKDKNFTVAPLLNKAIVLKNAEYVKLNIDVTCKLLIAYGLDVTFNF